MGYILHAATIAGYPSLADASIGEPWKTQRTEADAKLAKFRESLPENWRRLIVGPVESLTNGYAWLAFMPDGSKEGWELSDEGDDYREQFMELFGADFTVRWGDEEPWLTETYRLAKAEQMHMNRGHEPGVERLGATLVDDQWYDEPGQPLDPPSETAWGSIGSQQKTRMFAMFTGLGMRQKDRQMEFITSVIGEHGLNSRNDLSYVQAGQVLEALELRSGK